MEVALTVFKECLKFVNFSHQHIMPHYAPYSENILYRNIVLKISMQMSELPFSIDQASC